MRWARRGATGAVVALVALALAGMVWQALATRVDRRNFPPPGKLVDVGGYRLHINCAGAGHPTVVFEAGALAISSTAGWVQPLIARHTRVCSYDRAGLGWSEPGPEPRDALHIVRELHTLLRNAGETPPFVLAGASSGGLLVRVYADQYPEDVAGLALVDSSHPDQDARFEKLLGKRSFLQNHLSVLAPVLARLGVIRFLVRFTDIGRQIDELPPRQAGEVKAFSADFSTLLAGNAERALWAETCAQARATRPLGDLPLIVISAGGRNPASIQRQAFLEMHRELATLSSRGSHRVIAGADHISLGTNRVYATQVADAVMGLVEIARTGSTDSS